ncbi:MAG: class II fructose-bisphosphate aldolase [Oscillospiraceae bacterium]|jgi:fructose-bisphosphate aldolase class II|nr:class II fructose-bisphosphate aldolase [Oscillospiraceae bacterium]
MPLVTLKEILSEANASRYAVPAFDALEQISAEAVVRAAEQQKRPVIVMAPQAAFPLIDTAEFFPYLVWLARRASVPVALELDHGKDLEGVKTALGGGFTSVMIDGSALPLEENIALTLQVAELAHAAGASVEAEIGHVAGGEGSFEGSEVDESMYTDPAQAERFARETGVDALAVAVGTVHGVYKGTPKLDFERLADIKRRVGLPLVLHGGSGVSGAEFAKAIQGGVNKINLFTEISMAALRKSAAYAQEREMKLHFAEMLVAGKQAVTEIAAGYLAQFGGGGH